MPGDLWTGYLQAQAADVAEVEREEEKKRQRLEEQLQKLNMESLRRGMEKDARDWEREEDARAQKEEMFSRLEGFLDPEQMAVLRLGGDLSDWQDFTQERYEPTLDELAGKWRIGAGLEPKAGGGSTRSVTDAERAERYSKIPEDQRTEYQKKFLKKYFEGTRGGKAGRSQYEIDSGINLDDLGGEGGESSGADLDAQILETQKEIRELLESLK